MDNVTAYKKEKVDQLLSVTNAAVAGHDSQLVALRNNTIVTGVAISPAGESFQLSTTTKNLQSQESTTTNAPITLASETSPGVMPASAYSQIIANTAAIASLEGAANGMIRPTNTALAVDAVQEDVEAAWVAAGGATPHRNGDTLISLDSTTLNFTWTWFDTNSLWRYRGVGSTPFADNVGTYGVVTGANEDGKVFVEADHTMSVVGWDALSSSIGGGKSINMFFSGVSGTFTVPEGVTEIYITAVGGGAGGGAGAGTVLVPSGNFLKGGTGGGGGGGSGSWVYRAKFIITEPINVVFEIGAGGANGNAGANPGANGVSGGDTRVTLNKISNPNETIGDIIAYGGLGGIGSYNNTMVIQVGGMGGQGGYTPDVLGADGDSIVCKGNSGLPGSPSAMIGVNIPDSSTQSVPRGYGGNGGQVGMFSASGAPGGIRYNASTALNESFAGIAASIGSGYGCGGSGGSGASTKTYTLGAVELRAGGSGAFGKPGMVLIEW